MHAAPPPTQADLAAAFAADWGAPPPATHTITIPRDVQLDYAVQPQALVPLGGGRFALLEKETTQGGGHAAAGAASIAYLDRRGGAWRKFGDWREIAWNGESGGGNLQVVVRRDLGRRPLVLVTGSHLGQGYLTESAVVIRLDAERPVALGRIPLRADNTGSGGPNEYHYAAQVSRGGDGALLSVNYRGWTGPREVGGDRLEHPDPTAEIPYRKTLRFVLKGGCLAAVGGARVPDVDFAPQPRDCTASAPAKP
jgi:hypothetical protein